MSKDYNQQKIFDYIFDEYVFNNDKLVDISQITKNLELLVDNRLATKISGFYDTVITGPHLKLYNFICKFMCDNNKVLLEYLDNGNYSDYEDSLMTNRAGFNEELGEYLKYNFPIGIYTSKIKSKHSDEFMILQVESERNDTSYLNYSFYFIGRKCFKNRDKFYKAFKNIKESIGEDIPDTIRYSDGRESKETIFKSFDHMVFHDKKKYIDYIDNWVNSLPKYYEYGIIPKLSILLYGEPGTGKTTFCKALAKYLGISTITTVTPSYFSNEQDDYSRRNISSNSKYMSNKQYKKVEETIYSIDDIDCISLSRDKDESIENGRIMSSLLEFLDNPPTFYMKGKDGKYYQVAIVCATTNYYDRLDGAIKRFGRFDLTIPMNRFTIDEAKEMCSIYGLHLKDIYHDKYDKSTTFSPAQIQAQCMENIDKKLKETK